MSVNHDLSALDRETNLAKALSAWGTPLPEWVRLLAVACDRSNQRAVADRLGKSSPYISKIIRRVYPGDYGEAETLVRAAYSTERVMCPVAGSIALKTCIRFRRRAHTAQNFMHLQLDAACPSCPNNTDEPQEEE